MIRTYKPAPPALELERAGSVWLECDADDCTAEELVDGDAVRLDTDGRIIVNAHGAPMPDGWVTSNVDDDPVAGAAQFCPKHAGMVATPEE